MAIGELDRGTHDDIVEIEFDLDVIVLVGL